MATSPNNPTVKMSLLDKLTNFVYLDYVLKIGGIILFALGMFKAWSTMGLLTKTLVITGPIAWYVGDKFNKIYR